jgi:hypothetical protein
MDTLNEKTVALSPELPVVDIELDAIQKDASGRPLKTTASGVILVPQPSDDPEDPLVCFPSLSCLLRQLMYLKNWSFTQKHVAMVALAAETFLVKFSATLLVSPTTERICDARGGKERNGGIRY